MTKKKSNLKDKLGVLAVPILLFIFFSVAIFLLITNFESQDKYNKDKSNLFTVQELPEPIYRIYPNFNETNYGFITSKDTLVVICTINTTIYVVNNTWVCK